jgi:hypothetical protein
MKLPIRLLPIAGIAILAACAHPDLLRPGMTAAQLDARFGTPAAVRRDPDGDVRIYSSAPLGQRASAAHLDANGTVFRVEPLLNTEHFAKIVVGQWNKNDVLTHFGRPAEDTRIPGYEVWSFRYRENEQWDSMFHVMFDAAGVVRQTQNGPDPMYEKRDNGRD